MPERVTVREDLQIIQIDSYGEVTADDLRGSLDAVFGIRQERGFTKVFVDASRETSFPSTLPVFDFGSDLAQTARGMKFAIVSSPKTDSGLRFLETVTHNRGGQLRVFDSADAALAWLAK